MTIAEDLCFRLAKARVVRRDQALSTETGADQAAGDAHVAGANPHALDRDSYADWRDRSLDAQFRDHFDCSQVAGKRVLDFGSGTGYLTKLAIICGAASADGVDISEKDVEIARRRFGDLPGAVKPRFHLSPSAETIAFEDESFDVILCFDVLEHIMHYKAIIPEWKRVLAPGGRILIWWQPYYHPWGHHLHTQIPIPWAHALFSNETLAEVTHRIGQLPEYKPRFWDLDSEGKRISRPKPKAESLGGVNRMTIRTFEAVCKEAGFRIARRESHAFNGPKIVETISGTLSKVPFLDEFFSAYLIYEIEKPE